ncbi:MAG: YdeI/OmpD-associated family protein [Sandaracinaceae bacterium]|nr:YdeI/OmpD-associated family protein [Sandaracinaceae bacterium]
MAEKGIAFADLPIHAFATAEAFEAWLADHHTEVPAIAIRLGKKGSGIASITYPEALDVALCHGWIDGQSKSEGERTYLQRFGKRKGKSLWSKINREHVHRLIEAGRMRPAGLAEVERAKADGRWDAAYSSPGNARVPPDLAAALKKRRGARARFEALDAQNRYAILHRLETAKKPETRARRIAQFVELLANGGKPLR